MKLGKMMVIKLNIENAGFVNEKCERCGKNPCTFFVLVDNRPRKIGKDLACIHIGLVRITKKNV